MRWIYRYWRALLFIYCGAFSFTIAIFRVIQGCLTLFLGVKKLLKWQAEFEVAYQNHDLKGMAVAKENKKNAKIMILEGCFLGGSRDHLLATATTPVGTILLLYSVLMDVLFYVFLFAADAITSVRTYYLQYKEIKAVQVQFEKYIQAHTAEDLTDDDRKAAIRYLREVSFVTPKEMDNSQHGKGPERCSEKRPKAGDCGAMRNRS